MVGFFERTNNFINFYFYNLLIQACYNFYCRIPALSFVMDDQMKFPYGDRSANPRFVIRIYVPGLYEVEVKMPDMVRKF